MRTYLLLILSSLIVLTACKRNSSTAEKVATFRYAPPVAKPDLEVVAQEPPTEYETKSADPGPKSQEADANQDIRIEEPVGNADLKQVVELPLADNTAKKIIKEGDISFETSNVAGTRKRIIASVIKLGGYIQSDRETDNAEDNRKELVLEVKVPATCFDQLLNSVSSSATKIDSKNVSIRDVTAQFIDTKTRLENKKLLELRYLQLLKRAAKISEMLEIENKLEGIRSDIESAQGQFNYLNKQVAYSSLSVTFYTKQPAQVETSVSFWYMFRNSIGDGLILLQRLFFGFLSVWPYWITLFAVSLLIRRSWKRRRRLQAA